MGSWRALFRSSPGAILFLAYPEQATQAIRKAPLLDMRYKEMLNGMLGLFGAAACENPDSSRDLQQKVGFRLLILNLK